MTEEVLEESGVSLPKTQLDTKRWHGDDVNHENRSSGDDRDVRSQVADIRANMNSMMNRMMEQVQHVRLLEAQMGPDQDGDSEGTLLSSQEPPPAYVDDRNS